MPRRAVSVLVALCALVLLSSCRVDATVELTVEPDGSGQVTVEAIADAEALAQVPGLADDLRFDDLAAVGWVVTGPEATATDGLRVELVRSFASVAEAEAILSSLNGPEGPLVGMTVTRTATSERAEVVLAGTLRLDGGIGAFADSEMLADVGAAPFADEIEAGGYALGDVFSLRLDARLPGSVDTATGAEDGRVVSWELPLDGSAQAVQAAGVRSRDDSRWWRLGANAALLALVAWVLVAGAFLAYVVAARRRVVPRGAARRSG